jgi:hypothetical protein
VLNAQGKVLHPPIKDVSSPEGEDVLYKRQNGGEIRKGGRKG